MIPHKPYLAKPMAHSTRGEEVMSNAHAFLVRVSRDSVTLEARVTDPGQCLAALEVARTRGVGCLVYAVGTAFGEECMELVDEAYLRQRMGEVL